MIENDTLKVTLYRSAFCVKIALKIDQGNIDTDNFQIENPKCSVRNKFLQDFTSTFFLHWFKKSAYAHCKEDFNYYISGMDYGGKGLKNKIKEEIPAVKYNVAFVNLIKNYSACKPKKFYFYFNDIYLPLAYPLASGTYLLRSPRKEDRIFYNYKNKRMSFDCLVYNKDTKEYLCLFV